MTDKEIYDNARKAIGNDRDGSAFLQLGILFAKGIGTKQNHILANYYFEKALSLGCQEAEIHINQEYEYGIKNIVAEIENTVLLFDSLPPQKFSKALRLLERERCSKNFGNLSKLREHLHLFYPDYDQDKAIADILSNSNTVDADIFYVLSTINNKSEVNINMQEKLLSQLFAPIVQDEDLCQCIIASNNVGLLTKNERELIQCLKSLSSYYNRLCEIKGLEKMELTTIKPEDMFPFIKVSLLPHLRRQALRCLLSVRDVNPIIQDEYLINLDDDEELLNICERIEEENLQMFLISLVELNINMESLELTSLHLLRSYINNDLSPLASYLNEFVNRLNKNGIEHQLPNFNTDNLKFIDLTK